MIHIKKIQTMSMSNNGLLLLVILLLGCSQLVRGTTATSSNIDGGLFSSRAGFPNFPKTVSFFVNDTIFRPCAEVGQEIGYTIIISNKNKIPSNDTETAVERDGGVADDGDVVVDDTDTFHFYLRSDWGPDVEETEVTLGPGESHTFDQHYTYKEDDIGMYTIENLLQVYSVNTDDDTRNLTADVTDSFDINVVDVDTGCDNINAQSTSSSPSHTRSSFGTTSVLVVSLGWMAFSSWI